MQQLISILKQPHPANDDLRVYFRTIAAIAFMVLFTLFVMRPFGLSNLSSEKDIFLRSLTYSGTGYIVMVVNSLWLIYFPQLFRQEKWTVGKEVIYVLCQWFTISTVIWLVNLWLHKDNPDIVISSLARSILLAGASGMLPYFLVMTIRYFYLLKRNLRNAERLNETIPMNEEQPPFWDEKNSLFLITDDSKIPAISAGEFLFLESRGNYLHIFCEKSGIIKEYKLRNTVKEFRETNGHIPTLFHCHRAYLVNLMRIIHIEGNAAGYLLEMHPEIKKIPVSRSKISEFKQVLKFIKINPKNT